MKRGSLPELPKIEFVDPGCTVPDCEEKHYAKGLCGLHWKRTQQGTDLEKPKQIQGRVGCAIAECDRAHYARGFCRAHYQRNRLGMTIALDCPIGKHKKPTKRPDGLTADGYRVLNRPGHPNANRMNGQIFEHRLVMSEHLGRPLQKHENVHHINGDRADNRIENLELWTKAQPCGQRVEDKLQWARNFINEYSTSTEEDAQQLVN